jgi:hypothetical protein
MLQAGVNSLPSPFSATWKAVAVLSLLGAFQSGKAAPLEDELNSALVDAVPGTAEIVPQPGLREVVILFQQNVETNNKTKEYVLKLQLVKSSSLPPDWKGSAILYQSKGLTAIKGRDGTSMLFRFSTRNVPPSLAQQAMFTTYEVFGIARYGTDTERPSDAVIAKLLKDSVPTDGKQ